MPTFFSLVIPTYNSDKTLAACLDSIINQSFQDFEVLIIDGMSIDATLSIVKYFATLYPNIHWVSEKDEGIYDAMNKGIIKSNGNYIYFLGSDDELYDDKVLKNVFDFINIKPCNIVYGNVEFKSNHKDLSSGEVIYDGEFDLYKLKQKNICHQSIFYKLSFLKFNNSKFLLKYPICADWDFNLKLWFKTQFNYIDITIAYFSVDGTSSKNTYDPFIEKRIFLIELYSKQYVRFFLKKIKFLYHKISFSSVFIIVFFINMIKFMFKIYK